MIRTLALAITASLLATPAFAAKDPCKNVKVESNKFGSSRYLEAGDLRLRKTDGGWTMTIKFNAGGGYGGFTAMKFEAIPQGTPVEVLLEDQSKVVITTSVTAGPQIVAVMGVTATYYELTATVSDEDVKALSAQPIIAARAMKGTETWYMGEISKGDAKKFQEASSCMVTT